MADPQETHFTERISSYGFFFIISGVLGFFGFNNYAPYSYLAFSSPDSLQSFFNPDFSWFSIVFLWNISTLAVSIRLFRIRDEMNNPHFSRFGLMIMVSAILSLTITLGLFILSLLPTMYFNNLESIGIGYIAVNYISQILQIIAWISLFLIGRKNKTELGKDIKLNFGSTPIIFILGNLIAIGALTVSLTATSILNTGDFALADYLAMIGTYIYFGWVGLNLIGNMIVGIKILTKPSSGTKKSFATKQVKVKKAKVSCPVCRYTIYEGQNTCPNCGNRI